MRIKQFVFLLALTLGFTSTLFAQKDKSERASPPVQTTATLGDLTIDINYSSPAVKKRTIWDKLVPYGKVWRTGANEATTFEVDQDVSINGEELPAGKYALFTIPGEKEWTFIFNSVAEQWGAYKYDEEKDVLRVTAKPGKAPQQEERMVFEITTRGDTHAWVNLKWDELAVGFEVKTD
ncbi:MAG: hypothetical protein DHS20C18_35200 [Saprospiraceae bacterium]|nr:MAG: hypothetical protein DHS20C18_35200 [Saprospiraceae bacterium]